MSLEELVPKFKFTKLLNSDSQFKNISLLGTINGKDAIITIEKSHFAFDDSEITNFINNNITDILQITNNDVYYWGLNLLKQDLDKNPSSKLNLIYPATETHLKKFNKGKIHMITETPTLYLEIVKPYIETMKGKRIEWVRNILYKGAESESVVFRNDDFVLIPDMKWDGKNLETLYLCAIVLRDDISSIRDLNESHIEYLTDMQETIKSQVVNFYSSGTSTVSKDRLRIFVHYQPSYYHFHIHVVNTSFPGIGETINCGRAILLSDIIENLRFLGPKGYLNRSITYGLNDNHDLWELGLKNYV
ncbi:unnamed protein product [[Candida] boidinii]|uniref:Unnamed protein product n=1 Tax=Candida boidinii TaxID=5477 RepID=A0A9W6SWE4_CANBO|nr:hypothetical protein B5S30_g3895 [[Candida] boidinii]GME68411.1 unnamed protein product [[Candida] boidinii]GMG07632.1 unnamed protein product [[Candida] boidinii]